MGDCGRCGLSTSGEDELEMNAKKSKKKESQLTLKGAEEKSERNGRRRASGQRRQIEIDLQSSATNETEHWNKNEREEKDEDDDKSEDWEAACAISGRPDAVEQCMFYKKKKDGES